MGQPQGRDFRKMGVASVQIRSSATLDSGRALRSVQGDCWDCSLCLRTCQPPSLSLASPMMHSQLPVPALLCALLMLPLGMPRGFSDVPLTDAEVQTALAVAMQQYNDIRYDIPHYFKQVRLVKAKSQTEVIYKLTVEVAKTACEKKTDDAMPYYKIQRCKELPGNQLTCCSFTVSSRRDMDLDIIMCYKENNTCPNTPRNVKCL